MSEQLPAETIHVSAETSRDHEVAEFLRRHEVALVVLEGSEAGNNILVTRLPFLVGRGRRATMPIEHETVSRRHAELLLSADGRLEVLDLDSSNGCFVNGERVSSALLEDGDQLRFGSVRYQLAVIRRPAPTWITD